jgi:mannose-6-phosphate isomerase-like protein (cupin superfamily)
MEERSGHDLDEPQFKALRDRVRPVVLRAVADDWPAMLAARESDRAIAEYLARGAANRTVGAIAAAPSAKGRFFYTPDLLRLNFVKGTGTLGSFLQDLLRSADMPDPPAMAVQSEDLRSLIPGFETQNVLPFLRDVAPRIWIGNRIRVAPHYDAKENVAVCVAGRRRFTVFPPDQIANLYPGPFELTPAGTPVSMVDIAQPDLDAYPRYAEAAGHAVQATLEPGDAVYIPYGWWHGVGSEVLTTLCCRRLPRSVTFHPISARSGARCWITTCSNAAVIRAPTCPPPRRAYWVRPARHCSKEWPRSAAAGKASSDPADRQPAS